MVSPLEVELHGLFEENDTYDYGDYEPSEGDCVGTQCNSHQFVSVFIPILYSLVLMVGLLGNGLVLVVLCGLRRAWSVTDAIILHISVADTVLLITLPFWAVEATGSWVFSTHVCRLVGAIFKVNNIFSLFLLVFAILDFYLSTVHSKDVLPRWKAWQLQTFCLCLWFLCLLLCIPDWIVLGSKKRLGGTRRCLQDLCFLSRAERWFWRFQIFYHIFAFLLPSAFIVFCCTCILLRQRRDCRVFHSDGSLWMMLILIVSFLVCWTPYNVAVMVQTLHPGKGFHMATAALMMTAALACFHSCINPLLYIFFCVTFRHHVSAKLGLHPEARPNPELSLWANVRRSSPGQQPGENGQLNQISNVAQSHL